MIFIYKVEIKRQYRILKRLSLIKHSQMYLMEVQINTTPLERMLLKYMENTTYSNFTLGFFSKKIIKITVITTNTNFLLTFFVSCTILSTLPIQTRSFISASLWSNYYYYQPILQIRKWRQWESIRNHILVCSSFYLYFLFLASISRLF